MTKQTVTINGIKVEVEVEHLDAIAEMTDMGIVGTIEGNGYWLETPWDTDHDLTGNEVVGAILDSVDFCGLA